MKLSSNREPARTGFSSVQIAISREFTGKRKVSKPVNKRKWIESKNPQRNEKSKKMFVYVDRNGEFVTSTHRFDLRYKPNSGRNDAPPRELRFVCESSRLSAVVNSLTPGGIARPE